ncbi:monovalent cation/H+ antiporter subunit A [Castellaniella daejeonensis]|jgi:multicomponent K+:H+ antiporter subunit A|uniref:Monovalent cation/H+ antiporter subunit A n=1 Tax=Castellaniella daejeonensis TaxID=659013 RepID=A0ABN0TFL6_9BURK|nr:monovalent cation/H+ antiporter subunit A [Castellaniella sp.]HET8704413.1 monovalent cation/H+ antiporter subunit A [Castellaniella sp.]
MLLILILAIPFIGSLCASLLPATARRAGAWLAGGSALACLILTLLLTPEVAASGVIKLSLPWIPTLGVDLTLRMDGYAWLFSVIVSAMGALIALYAHYYLSARDPVPRFFTFLLSFMGAMLGVVLAGNLIQLLVFWELTSLSSFMLIGYWHHRMDARRGARMALLVTGTGGFCLLASMLIIGHIVGSYDLDAVLAAATAIRGHRWYPILLVLLALGALTKSAQFPFHFWLPNAMAAPTPVSAYLHSATMVKAGVFLLARFWPIFSGTDWWTWIIGGAGLCSLLLGAYAATFQRDMKGVLAYSTISHLGLITLLLGMNSRLALVAAIFHIINHATFKASLFMAAGIVDHESGTRDLTRLSGLRTLMPLTATLAMVSAAAMAGVPLLNGFISKEMFFAETVFITGHWASRWGLPIAAVVAGALSVAYSLRFILQVFFGPQATDLPRTPHDPPRMMLIPCAVLVLFCLSVGILPGLILDPVLNMVMRALLGDRTPVYDLQVWHGLNLPLLMSLVAMAAGIGLYLALRERDRRAPGQVPLIYRLDGRQSFEALLEAIDAGSAALLARLQTQRLQPQVLLLVLSTGAVALLPLLPGGWWPDHPTGTPAQWSFGLMWLAGGACAVVAAYQAKYHRAASLMLAGAAGLVTCVTFAWLSAPDLALTQLTVEVVTTVLILLGLRWLPPRIEEFPGPTPMTTRWRRLRDFLVALAAGATMTVLSYVMMTRLPAHDSISAYFVQQAWPLGGGANVVNVILVDFRAFDTFGEITVLGVVALSVYALLRRFRPPAETIAAPLHHRGSGDTPAPFEEPDLHAPLPEGTMRVPAVLIRLLLPVSTLISLYFLLRGHNLPGGGFIGGLIMATGIILQYMAGGILWVEARPLIRPQAWIALGLMVAGAAAMAVWWVGKPLLAAHAVDLILPLVGTVHLSSVLLFDLGVYMLVVGATVLMIIALAHQSLRFYRKLAEAAGASSTES